MAPVGLEQGAIDVLEWWPWGRGGKQIADCSRFENAH